jgi:formylmethanofuran dehydrogenase subunit C
MALQLHYREKTNVPVEVEGVSPDRVAHMSCKEIERIRIFVGNTQVPLAELFDISGDPSDQQLDWHGDLSGVHWIGARMVSGSVRIHGSVGRHMGSEMSGGQIDVEGDAGDWVGAELKGGMIRIRGSAGHLVGGAYRGSRRGMTGGTIVIDGNVGNEIGHSMRRGLLVVRGAAGDLIGFNMLAGTILVLGTTGIRHGAGMKRGTLGLLGRERPSLLPSFRYACRTHPLFLRLVFKHLDRCGFLVDNDLAVAEVDTYHGDLLEGGRGEILLRAG